MPFGPKWTTGILGHYSKAWAIAPRLGAEACGRRGRCGSEPGAGGSQWKSWKSSGSRWETGKGSEGVREGQERSGRPWESVEEAGSNGTLQYLPLKAEPLLTGTWSLSVGSISLYIFLKRISKFDSPVLGLYCKLFYLDKTQK